MKIIKVVPPEKTFSAISKKLELSVHIHFEAFIFANRFTASKNRPPNEDLHILRLINELKPDI